VLLRRKHAPVEPLAELVEARLADPEVVVLALRTAFLDGIAVGLELRVVEGLRKMQNEGAQIGVPRSFCDAPSSRGR
jgi:hypothetical protein